MHRWIVLLLLACAACAGKKQGVDTTDQIAEFSDMIEDVVQDPDRRARALEEYEAFAAEAGAFFEELRDAQAEAQRLNADYDAPRASFEAIRVRMRASRRRHSENVVHHALAIREIVTSEEWAAINDAIRKERE